MTICTKNISNVWRKRKFAWNWQICVVSNFIWSRLFIYLQKRMRIKKLPTILALHLKRFKYMEQYNRHIKVSHRVVFPLELRLFNTVSKPYCKVTDSKEGRYLKLHGQVVMWRIICPLWLIRINWSAKTWVGNCPTSPPISYVPASCIDTFDYWYI